MQVSHAGAPDARSAPSVLDRPVGGALDDGGRRLVAWGEGPARTPLTVEPGVYLPGRGPVATR